MSTQIEMIEQLCRNSRQYSFFQLVFLLEKYGPYLCDDPAVIEPVGREFIPHHREILRFRPEASFAFPVADVAELHYVNLACSEQYDEKTSRPLRSYREMIQAPAGLAEPSQTASNIIESRQYFVLTATCLGLYGTVSPLPAYYTEAIIAADLDDHQRREFLDVFHHRLYSLLYRIWKKYRYYIQYRRGARDVFSTQMFSLMGLGDKNLRIVAESPPAPAKTAPAQAIGVNWVRLLTYTGLLGMHCRSAAVMENIIAHYFRGLPVEVEQCVLRWVTIEPAQRNRLGGGYCTLGESFTIGAQVADRAGKFRVRIGPLKFAEFQDFLPNGKYHHALRALVQFLLIDQLDFDLLLMLEQEEIPPWQLSADAPCRLGWSGWMGTGAVGEVVLAGR